MVCRPRGAGKIKWNHTNLTVLLPVTALRIIHNTCHNPWLPGATADLEVISTEQGLPIGDFVK